MKPQFRTDKYFLRDHRIYVGGRYLEYVVQSKGTYIERCGEVNVVSFCFKLVDELGVFHNFWNENQSVVLIRKDDKVSTIISVTTHVYRNLISS